MHHKITAEIVMKGVRLEDAKERLGDSKDLEKGNNFINLSLDKLYAGLDIAYDHGIRKFCGWLSMGIVSGPAPENVLDGPSTIVYISVMAAEEFPKVDVAAELRKAMQDIAWLFRIDAVFLVHDSERDFIEYGVFSCLPGSGSRYGPAFYRFGIDSSASVVQNQQRKVNRMAGLAMAVEEIIPDRQIGSTLPDPRIITEHLAAMNATRADGIDIDKQAAAAIALHVGIRNEEVSSLPHEDGRAEIPVLFIKPSGENPAIDGSVRALEKASAPSQPAAAGNGKATWLALAFGIVLGAVAVAIFS